VCTHKDCGTPTATTPWCDICTSHITETSHQLHVDRNHKQDPREPGPLR
jgi:hypothetical protein